MWHTRLSELSAQLALCYNSWDDIKVVCTQEHGRLKINNSFFTIANCIMLINGDDPIQFKLERNLKKQLIEMLTINKMKLFQATFSKRDEQKTVPKKTKGEKEKEREKYKQKREKMTEGEKEKEREK